jgi:hypothetical protein
MVWVANVEIDDELREATGSLLTHHDEWELNACTSQLFFVACLVCIEVKPPSEVNDRRVRVNALRAYTAGILSQASARVKPSHLSGRA